MDNQKLSGTKRKAPKTNQERSKQYRIRKKMFFQETIDEWSQLKEQVRVLKKQNAELKDQIYKLQNTNQSQVDFSCRHSVGSSAKPKFEHPLHEYNDYVYNRTNLRF